MGEKNDHPLRIGLLCSTQSIGYITDMRQGIESVLRQAGAQLVLPDDLLTFMDSTGAEGNLQVAFALAAALDLDGYIVPASSTDHLLHHSPLTAGDFLTVLDSTRTVIIDREIPGFRSIIKDDEEGIYQLTRHLVRDLSLTRIGFIRGDASSGRGAALREAGWIRALSEAGLPVEDRMETEGSYSGNCVAGASQLLDQYPEAQAIVCSNDQIAITLCQVMEERGLVPGRDIAVTGFDNIPESLTIDPPLTTASVRPFDLGAAGARELLRLLRGEPQEVSLVHPEILIRSSSGDQVPTRRELLERCFVGSGVDRQGIADLLVRDTVTTNDAGHTARLRALFLELMDEAGRVIAVHRARPWMSEPIFSPELFLKLFSPENAPFLSLPSFLYCLEDLAAVYCERADLRLSFCVLAELSRLSLRAVRHADSRYRQGNREQESRSWFVTQVFEDTLHLDSRQELLRSVMEDVRKAGIDQAWLLLFAEPAVFSGDIPFTIPELVLPGARIDESGITVEEEPEPIPVGSLASLLSTLIPVRQSVLIAPLIADGQVSGLLIAGQRHGVESDFRPLFLTCSYSIRHLQMIRRERELVHILERTNISLTATSQHDSLTGLLNRRGFDAAALTLLQRSAGRQALVLLLDMDGLKAINDTWGHSQGDAAIIACAQILRQSLDADCPIARYGGDEYIALTLSDQPEEIEHRLCETLQRRNARGDLPFVLEFSLGYRSFLIEADTPSHLAEYIRQADLRLYEMKRRHKNSRSAQEAALPPHFPKSP